MKTIKTLLQLLSVSTMLFLLTGCIKKTETTTIIVSSDNWLSEFKVVLPDGTSKPLDINVGDTVSGVLPPNISQVNLAVTFKKPDKAIVDIASGTKKDFTVPVSYNVKAESGSTRRYTVMLRVPSSAKSIKSFTINNVPAEITIDTSNKKVKIKMPPAIDPSSQTPLITVSDRATISPASGLTQNFFNPVTYTVRAEDTGKAVYTTELLRPAASIKDIPKAPLYYCQYNGYPSLANSSGGNTTLAANVFRQFDIIVLADTLVSTIHPDHTKTIDVMSKTKVLKPSVKFYGYIDIGIITHNYTDTQLKAYIDKWKAMGAYGVFGDDFGYDFGVNRERQNAFVQYAHSKGMSVIANSWNIEDALGGTDSKLDSTDYYLLESFLIAHGTYADLSTFKSRGDRAYYFMKTKKVGIISLNTLSQNNISASSNTTDMYKQSFHGTAMYNFDAFQFTNEYHSSNSQVFYFQHPITSYGTSWLQFDWIKKISDNKYERSSNTNTFYITGDGATYGTGGH